MKFPEDLPQIIETAYKGPRDEDGYPHGYGTLEYFTKTEKKYKYEEHFVHGIRSGHGEVQWLVATR